MYAIGINGSPRKGGNTQMLVNTVLDTLSGKGWETEFVQLGGETIRGCQACSKCFKAKDGKCAFQDDCFQGIYDKIMKADAVIMGSPTYYSDVTAEVKALCDRVGYVSLANGRALKGKIDLETGVSDRTWVEALGDASSELKDGMELAVAFSKETGAPGTGQ